MTKTKMRKGVVIPGYPGYAVVSEPTSLQVIGRYGPMPIEDRGDDVVTDYVVCIDRHIAGVRRAKIVRVAELICRAYHGAPAPGQIPVHISGDTSCVLPSNLKWGTFAEAKSLRYKFESGESTLTLQDRQRIWDMYRVERIRPQDIASEFECYLNIVFGICTDKRPS